MPLVLLALLAACGSSPPPAPAEPEAASSPAPVAAAWTCPMHPEVHQDHPGACPTCGMDLVEAAPGAASHASPDHMQHMAEVRTALQAKLGAAYDAPVPHLEHADMARGAETFAQLCSPCHGPAGKGDGPAGAALDPRPADLTDPAHARTYSDAGRVDIIRHGIPLPGSPMVGFGASLDDAATLDLYAYVASLRGPEPAADAPSDHAAPSDHGAPHQH